MKQRISIRPTGGRRSQPGQGFDLKVGPLTSPGKELAGPGVDSEADPASAPSVADLAARRAAGSADLLTLYLQEIGQVPLLRPEEQMALARRVQEGDAAAREQMIKANLRLVVKIARDFAGGGLPLLDLINEGNIGLMKAVERFDPSRGVKLSVYASFWIKQRMRRAIANQSRTVRLPVHVHEKLGRVSRARLGLMERLGREPADEEIAQQINCSAANVSRFRSAAHEPLPLDGAGNEEDGLSLTETVADENTPRPSHRLEQAELVAALLSFFERLPPRDQTVLRLRFGLDNGGERTLDQVGSELGLTRERIRQIQNRSLQQLLEQLKSEEAEVTA